MVSETARAPDDSPCYYGDYSDSGPDAWCLGDLRREMRREPCD
jgi:hypothetical protein